MRPDFRFNHLKETGYALEGAHAKAACLSCHNDRKAADVYASRGCSSCHQDPHQSKQGLDCKRCHSDLNWKPLQSAMGQHAQTRFPLTGVHAAAQCVQCHPRSDTSDFKGAPVDCFNCHQSNFAAAPNHTAQNFSHTCQDCHNTTSFTGAVFNHASLGGNPNCYGCHQPDYQRAQSPNHVSLGIPTTCTQCHNTSTWLGATFDHSAKGFPLTGKHATAQCADCHVGNNYNLVGHNCVPCHQADYNGATSPVNHPAAPSQFPVAACQTCHGDFQAWTNARFDHTSTGFALTGRHATAQCVDCHVGNNYNLVGHNCVPCHQADYNGAVSPVNHPAAPSQFPVAACQTCHGDFQAWTNARFDHTSTGFSLTGKHATAQCVDCHVGNNYNLVGHNCVPCHQADYNGAVSPVNHPAAPNSFPVSACQSCHGDFLAWTNARFDHATTGFPLVGRHAVPPRACSDCHVNNNYNITNTACISCHQTDYNGATSPLNHVQSNLTNCQDCHSPNSLWTTPTYSHSSAGRAGARPWTHEGARTCAVCHNTTSGYPTAGSGWFTCAGNGAITACHEHRVNPNVLPR